MRNKIGFGPVIRSWIQEKDLKVSLTGSDEGYVIFHVWEKQLGPELVKELCSWMRVNGTNEKYAINLGQSKWSGGGRVEDVEPSAVIELLSFQDEVRRAGGRFRILLPIDSSALFLGKSRTDAVLEFFMHDWEALSQEKTVELVEQSAEDAPATEGAEAK